jgi:membrane protease YdiL (CAAX protease family)
MMENQRRKDRWQRRAAALGEVLGVLLVGNLIARAISTAIGLANSKQQLNAITEGSQPDFLKMAWVTGGDLLIKYGLLFGLAFAIGWWHRKRKLKAYGLTRGGFSTGYLILIGIVLFAMSGFLPKLFFIMNRYVFLGEGPRHWSVLAGQTSLAFWVFMAVSSFALVPVVEELFARGYMQTRLTEDFGPGAAILIIAFIFAFSHSQYYKLEMMSIGMLVSIILGSIFMGYVFYKTRSLLPVIIAHAIGNIPMRGGQAETFVFLSMVAVMIIFGKQIAQFGKELWKEIKAVDTMAALVFILVLIPCFFIIAILYLRSLLVIMGILLAAVAIFLEYREKRLYNQQQ